MTHSMETGWRDPEDESRGRWTMVPRARVTIGAESAGARGSQRAVSSRTAIHVLDRDGELTRCDTLAGLPRGGGEGVAPRVDPNAPLSEVMTRDVVCSREDVPLSFVRETLLERGIHGMAVVDERLRPVGFITLADILTGQRRAVDARPSAVRLRAARAEADDDEWLFSQEGDAPPPPPAVASDVMMPFAFILPADAPVATAAAFMAHEGVDHIVVVGKTMSVVGVLTSLDVARWVAARAGLFG